MKLIQLLKEHILQEYKDAFINQMVKLYKPQTEDSEDQIKVKIKRFEQITDAIAKKLADKNPILDRIMPDELKVNNKFRDITQYKEYALLVKVIQATDIKPVDVYKQAIERYKKMNQYMPPQIIGNYVARFKQNLKDLIEKVNEEDEDALKLIPKKLLQKDAYQSILNWVDFHELEVMLDGVFPIINTNDKEEETNNDASTNADLIYENKEDGIEIYVGDEEHKCIKYGDGYNWCIGRGLYANYRYMQIDPTLNRLFYFIFDRTQSKEDPYHACVIHVNTKGLYTRTTSKNDGDHPYGGTTWDKLGDYFQGESGAIVWDKIKNLGELFKFIPPNKDEQRRLGFRGQRKTLEEFIEMDHEDKRDWLRANATDINIVNTEITKSLPADGEVSRNELINYNRIFNFDELKDSRQLLRRYAEYRFSVFPKEALPILFLPYLKDESKSRYYNKFKEKGITFEYALKYFGEEIAKDYVNEQVTYFKFIPETAISYISDPKQKALYTIIHKLYKNWKYDASTNLSDKELEDLNQMPEARINPIPFTYQLWKGLSAQERKIIMAFVKKYGNENRQDYDFIKYAMPYLVILPEGEFVLVPLESNESNEYIIYNEYNDWVLSDENGNIYKYIDGEKTETQGGNNLQSGFIYNALENSRILKSNNVKLIYNKNKINEIKYSLLKYKDILNIN